MEKIYTQKFFNHLYKILLVAVVVLFFTTAQSNVARAEDSSELQAKTIKCYPNPATSFTNFEFPLDYISKDYSLQIYSFTGKKVYETTVTSVKLTLTFNNNFYRGIYIYQLQDKSGRILETGKLQVNR